MARLVKRGSGLWPKTDRCTVCGSDVEYHKGDVREVNEGDNWSGAIYVGYVRCPGCGSDIRTGRTRGF